MSSSPDSADAATALNILGEPLEACSYHPLTGFTRSGACETGPQDRGSHSVCARVTEEFLDYSRARGNDLTTPQPEYGFPGLQPGDSWCLCAARWLEALKAGVAPPVLLRSTHARAADVVEPTLLKSHALDLN
ncbi:MAG: DUF2237 domain-containing protein [Thiobacillaceae bacterium]|jgi:hypothetical protein|nr:DUF2237 domain-containing protein [Thiobacillaceae bacterium]